MELKKGDVFFTKSARACTLTIDERIIEMLMYLERLHLFLNLAQKQITTQGKVDIEAEIINVDNWINRAINYKITFS